MSNEAEGTQEDTAPALKYAVMVGRAVATIVESSVVITIQQAIPKKTMMSFLKGSRFVWSISRTLLFPLSSLLAMRVMLSPLCEMMVSDAGELSGYIGFADFALHTTFL